MTIKELNAKRTTLYGKIKGLADQFKANGNKWAGDAERSEWEQVNGEYDAVCDQLGVAGRVDAIGREMNAPINPLGIGLDDAGDGMVGKRPAPGGSNARRGPERHEYVIDQKGRKQRLLRAGDSLAAELARREPKLAEQCAGVEIGDYMRAMALGPRSKREFNALMGGTSAGYTVPTRLAAELIDLLRAKSRVVQAGAGTIRLDTEETAFARLLTEPTPGWVAEGVAMSEKDATFGKILFRARTLRMLIKASRELLEDSINLNQKLPEVFANAMAAEVDRVALFGTGAGTGEGPEPLGVINYQDINVVDMGANGAAIADYAPLLDAVELIETDNAEAPTAAIMHPRTKRAFGGLADSTGQPLMRPEELKGMAFLTTTKQSITETHGTANNASSIILGGFRELVLAIRSDVRIDLLTERYAEEFSYGFLVSMRADVGAFHEQAFGKIVGVIPA